VFPTAAEKKFGGLVQVTIKSGSGKSKAHLSPQLALVFQWNSVNAPKVIVQSYCCNTLFTICTILFLLLLPLNLAKKLVQGLANDCTVHVT